VADLLEVLVHANQVLQVSDVVTQAQDVEDAGRADFWGQELGIVGLFVGFCAVADLGCFGYAFGG